MPRLLWLIWAVSSPVIHSRADEQLGLFSYVVTGDTVQITDFSSAREGWGDVVIPAEIEGKPVTAIGNRAFFGASLTSVRIPGSVTQIGGAAFADCKSLTSVSIPESVTEIGNNAFAGCRSLTSVMIPGSVARIGFSAFVSCSSLASVTIERGVEIISSDAFHRCEALTNITIPGSVTAIGGSAFELCRSLTSVTIEEGVESVGGWMFRGCKSLTSVSIPESVTTIGSSAFRECRSLTKVSIPGNVSRIGKSAFEGCSTLSRVIIPASVTRIFEAAFSECHSLTAALFLGDSPKIDDDVFRDVGEGFTIYYPATARGFPVPSLSFPFVMLDEVPPPSGLWLFSHGMPLDTDLSQDLNGDGVSLLFVYALNLNPAQKLSGGLPVKVLDHDGVSLSFYGKAPGIVYLPQTSKNLRDWTGEGVVMSKPGPDGTRTATVTQDGKQRFMRLLVEIN